jgi:RNA polymerase subunit RPABC4/transcription elongation factor Spt4
MDEEFRRPPARMEPAKGTKPGGDFRVEPIGPPPAGAHLKPCPDCGRLVPGDSKKCVHCGFGIGSAPPPSAPDGPPKPCAFCQYDLRGSPSNTCPECGKAQPRRNRRSRDELASREVYVRETRKAWFYIVVGVAIPLISVFAFTHSLKATVNTLILFGAIDTVAFLIYGTFGLLWMGFDAGLRSTFFRITACVAATYAASVAVIGLLWAFGCFGYVTMVLPVLVYTATLADLMEHDFSDAVIIALVTVGGCLGIWFVMLNLGLWV